MEHRLIEGGFQYLPFARSRIKALRAAGRDYATERFILDDATVAVRIVGDMEYIHITGGGCTLRMDSGVVDIGVVNENNPDRYKPGYLHESNAVAAYNAAFVPTTPVSSWRLNPSELSAGQLSGEVKKLSKFKGRVPYDHLTARSFTPKSAINPDPPPVTIPSDGDEDLADKKTAIAYCPASMFTGRTRLYVQAMYGQYLYKDDSFDSAGNNTAKAYVAPEKSENELPSLSVQAYQKADDDTVYPRVEIIVNTGIYLDPTTGKHWLMTVYYGYVTVYPLISSPCGESLRKYLITTDSTLKDPLDETDRNHLEAYILSCSLPWVKNKVEIALNSSVVPYSFGYGWHWNWSGTTADIVNHITVPMPYSVSSVLMKATHSRLTMTLSKPDADTDVWSGSISTVEGPEDWTLNRPVWCLAVPRWQDMRAMPDDGPPVYYLYKPTPDPELTSLFVCNAPFYVFYAKDVLQVCRVIITQTPAVDTRYSWTYGMAAGDVAGDNSPTFPGAQRSTVGMLGGFIDTKGGTGAYWTLKVTCGDQSVENLDYGRHQQTSTYESIDNKFSWGQPTPWSGGGGTVWADYYYREGYPPWAITTVRSFEPELHGHDVSADWDSYAYVADWDSRAAIAIPFYDAEAIYIKGYAEQIKGRSTRILRYIASANWKISERPFFLYGDPNSGGQIYTFYAYSPTYGWDYRHSPYEVYLPDDVVTTVVVDSEWLSCRAGRYTCDFGFDFDLFFGLGDTVGTTFDTRVSCDFGSPVIFGRLPVVGATGQAATVMRPGLVGWA